MLKEIIIVLAQWCPHCVPFTRDEVLKWGKELKVPVVILDIDNSTEEKAADELVAKYGDWTPDYLIPQIFFRFSDGKVKHVFTGYPEGVAVTRKKLLELRDGPMFAALVEQRKASQKS